MYYKELKLEIANLIDNKAFNEALVLIDDELKMPYIPTDFEAFLIQQKQFIIHQLKDRAITQTHDLTIEKMIEILNDETDPMTQMLAIKQMEQLNIRAMIEPISHFFKNEKMSPENKTFLLITLYNQQIDHQFKVYKNGQTIQINPMQMNFKENEKTIDTICQTINNLIGIDNPGLANVCFSLALTYWLIKFPANLNLIEQNALIAISIKQGHFVYGINLDWDELHQLIEFDQSVGETIDQEFRQFDIGGTRGS